MGKRALVCRSWIAGVGYDGNVPIHQRYYDLDD